MSEQRILELEQLLLTANGAVATLTTANAKLTEDLAQAETRAKKAKRSSRNDEYALRQELATAQSRRG